MKWLANTLFVVWILSLPFYNYSLIGTLSLDNLLAPVMVILWLLLVATGGVDFGPAYTKNVLVAGALAMFYFLVHVIKLITTQQAVWWLSYTLMIDTVYFILPVLYLANERMRQRTDDCIILITMVGCLSAFLASIGVLHLEVSRIAESRISIESLKKTIGLFGVYGDMALLISFTAMATLSQGVRLLFVRKHVLVQLLIFAAILLGIIGSQSRNIVITLFVSVTMFFLVGRWVKRGPRWTIKFYLLFFVGGIAMVLVLVSFWDQVVSLLASWGGSKEAAGTVYDRLQQYRFGWNLIHNDILFGAPPGVVQKFEGNIIGIHNMWLKELVVGGLFSVMTIAFFVMRGMLHNQYCLRLNPADYPARVRFVMMLAMIVSTQFNPSSTSVFWMLLGVSLARTCMPSPIAVPSMQEKGKRIPARTENLSAFPARILRYRK